MAEGRNDESRVMSRGEPSSRQTLKENNKPFDAFFSYNENDTEIISKAVEDLEGPPHSLKICDHKRDFLYGVFISDNIEKFMNESEKFVLFLSKSFVKSRWCTLERQVAIQMSHADMRKAIIPVLLEDCEIPSSLRFLRYLDFKKNFNVELLAKALKEDHFEGSSFYVRAAATDRYSNGEIITRISTKLYPKCGRQNGCIKFDEDDCPVSLLENSSLTRNECKNIISEINELPFVKSKLTPSVFLNFSKHLSIYGALTTALKCFMHFFVPGLFFVLFELCFFDIINYISEVVSPIFVVVILFLLVFSLYYVWFKCFNKLQNTKTNSDHELKELHARINVLNKSIRDKNVLVIFSLKLKEIGFVFFKSHDCQKHLIDKLSSCSLVQGLLINHEYIQTLNEFVDEAIKDTIIQVYLCRRETPTGARHITQGLCSCQYLEKNNLKPFFACTEVDTSNEEERNEMLNKLRVHFSENFRSHFKNSQVIATFFIRQNSPNLLGVKFRISEVSLTNLSVALTEYELKEIVRALEELPYFKYFNITTLGSTWWSLIILAYFLFFVVLLDLPYYIITNNSERDDLKSNVSAFFAVIIPVLMTLIMHFIVRSFVLKKHRLSTQNLLKTINSGLMFKNLACHVDDLKLVFFHHFTSSCRQKIRDMIHRECLSDYRDGLVNSNDDQQNYSLDHDFHIDNEQCPEDIQTPNGATDISVEGRDQEDIGISATETEALLDIRVEESDTTEHEINELMLKNMFDYLQYRLTVVVDIYVSGGLMP